MHTFDSIYAQRLHGVVTVEKFRNLKYLKFKLIVKDGLTDVPRPLGNVPLISASPNEFIHDNYKQLLQCNYSIVAVFTSQVMGI